MSQPSSLWLLVTNPSNPIHVVWDNAWKKKVRCSTKPWILSLLLGERNPWLWLRKQWLHVGSILKYRNLTQQTISAWVTQPSHIQKLDLRYSKTSRLPTGIGTKKMPLRSTARHWKQYDTYGDRLNRPLGSCCPWHKILFLSSMRISWPKIEVL